MTELSGATVLVVGGARLLGRAIAEHLAGLGADVVIGARQLGRARSAAAGIPRARATRIDVDDEAGVAAAAKRLSGLDHVVCLAASYHQGPLADVDAAAMTDSLRTKVVGPMLLAKHFAPRLPRDGSLVLFGGSSAWSPQPGKLVMGVTNGAVSFLAAHLARELAPRRVNAIAPGVVDSGFWDGLGDEREPFFDWVSATLPAGRVGTATEVGEAVAYLLGAGFLTGETLHLDGGERQLGPG